MTVEEFLKNHPEGGLQVTNGYAWPLVLDGGKPVSAYGYTDGVLLGPDVKLSKKREIEWEAWEICPPDCAVANRELPYESVKLPDGSLAYRWGQYADAPEEENPELSQFLPDGWEWVYDKKYKKWGCAGNGYTFWCWSYDTKAFIDEGCLPPSEGGGFLKHKSGYPMPANLPDQVDLLYGDDETVPAFPGDPRLDPKNSSTYWENRSLPAHCTIVGYRPHITDKTK